MILRESTALLFTLHLVFLFVKSWFLYKLTSLFSLIQTPKEEKHMLLLEKKSSAYFSGIYNFNRRASLSINIFL